MPEISIIVPVYNVAEYLDHLITDILKQSFSNFELLLVNNCSTDGSEDIIQRYVNQDSRVRLLQQSKQGVGFARNKGLEEAKGTYIVFFDGDDRVDADILERFWQMMKTDRNSPDLVVCGYITEYRGEIVEQTAPVKQLYMNREEYLCSLYEDDTVDYQGFLWDKIFRREIIEKWGLRFAEDISYNEDRLFLTEYMLHGEKVAWMNEWMYHYQVREDSAMGAGRGFFASEAEMSEIAAFQRILKVLEAYPEAYALAKQNMAIAQLRLFRRMLDKKGFLRYRKSSLRKYARKFHRLGYQPRTYNEKIICAKLIFYGYTGICYSGVDTRDLE